MKEKRPYRWYKGTLLEQRSERQYQAFFADHPRVFLFGAGHGAERMARFLRSCNLQAAGILVSDGQMHAADIDGVSVRELSQTRLNESDGIIVTLRRRSQAAIVEELLQYGIHKEQILCQALFYQSTGNETVDGSVHLPCEKKTGPYFAAQRTLEAIGEAMGTDKCKTGHDYLQKYEFFLSKFRGQPITLLELGVFHGDSLRMWSRYFPEAHIVGVDIDQNCLTNRGGNCDVIITDLSEVENLQALKACCPTVIVDDASHMWSHQIKALFTLWDALPHGGVYILEDLATSFASYRAMGYDDAPVPAYDVLAAIAEIATSKEYLRGGKHEAVLYGMKEEIERIGGEVDMMTFLWQSCIMIKA